MKKAWFFIIYIQFNTYGTDLITNWYRNLIIMLKYLIEVMKSLYSVINLSIMKAINYHYILQYLV